MADRLPKFIVMKSLASNGCGYYMNQTDAYHGYVSYAEKSVFSPLAKIEVERSKIGYKFVHLRFCHSNKYWARRGPGDDDHYIVASSNQPEEDTSKLSCTLFEPTFGGDGLLHLAHVQSGGSVRTNSTLRSSPVYVDEDSDTTSRDFAFTFVDWDTLVKMPKRVSFKGDNGKYLKGVWYDGRPWKDGRPNLQFSSEDGNHEYSTYEVQLNPNGYVRIKSEHFGKYWRRSPNWIWGDSSDDSGKDIDTLFWPVKVDGRTIALRNAGNDHFCSRLTTDNKRDCLNAAVANITTEAKLVVEEVVFERSIYNVRYRMEDARIFDEKPFLAGFGTASNQSDTDSSLTIRVAYQDTRTYSFSNTVSITTGVKTTIKAGMPDIVEGQIEVSTEITGSFEWERTTEEKEIAEAMYTVNVPARSRVRVNYVGTRGKCSVPFSYTQRDKSSSDGKFVMSQHVDGIFNGVNYYSFRFDQLAVEPL